MSEYYLIGLGSIFLFGIIAQWLAWRFHLPSILLLLIMGIVAGPVSGLVDSQYLFGQLLFPFVSLSVGIILFEGGLSLRFSEFRSVGKTIRNLISIGALVTWIIATLAAYFLLEFEFKLALLFGAILIVTGPTVILPLLRQVRPKGMLHAIAKWEGIIIDPVGAIVAVLVFEEIISGGFENFTAVSVFGLLKTLALGFGAGWIGAQVIIYLLRRYWIPDFLHNSVAIMIVIMTFIVSNLLQKESGLVTATILGIFLANQNKVSIKHIIEFKENLRVILISSLFIVLAARLKIEDLAHLNTNTFIFMAILIFVARPLSVYLSTIGQNLSHQEKLFLAWLAPRGIVAASVSSVFALELTSSGYPDAERLIPLTFIIIIVTVTLYGLSAVPLARKLKISEPNPQGVLLVGAHVWSIEFGCVLKELGFRVLLVDSNPVNIYSARAKGLEASFTNVLAEDVVDQIDLQGIGRLFAVTANDEVNALAALHFVDLLGRSEVYQLPHKKKLPSEQNPVPRHLRGRRLFGENITYERLQELFTRNQKIKIMEIKTEHDIDAINKEEMLPLILVNAQKNILVYTDEQQPKPLPGTILIYQNH